MLEPWLDLVHNFVIWLMHWLCPWMCRSWKILFQVCDLLLDRLKLSVYLCFFSNSLQLLYVYFLFLFRLFPVESPGSEQLKSSAIVPPPTVLERVLKDLCHEGTHLQLFLVLLFSWLTLFCLPVVGTRSEMVNDQKL